MFYRMKHRNLEKFSAHDMKIAIFYQSFQKFWYFLYYTWNHPSLIKYKIISGNNVIV